MNNGARKEEEIFERARRILDPRLRQAYLEKACGGNAALYQQLEALLSAYSEADSFLAKWTGHDEPAGEAD